MKLFVVLYAADYTVRKAAYMGSFRRASCRWRRDAVRRRLLLREPDFGAFVVITVIAMGVLFLGGMNWRLFAGLLLLLGGLRALIWTSPYRMQRILGFMDPWADPFGKRLPAVARADRLRARRMVRRRAGRQRREALLPARGAHRLPARGDRRGARLRRRDRR
jgi:hypothetical protein